MRWAVLTALFALPAMADDAVSAPPLPRATVGNGSASRMMMGIRASFSGTSVTTAGLGGSVSTLNGVLFLTDQLALVASFGFGIGSTNNGNGNGTTTVVGFQIGGGIDYFFRDPSANLRPVVGGIVSIFKNYTDTNVNVLNDNNSSVGLSLLASAGLAYFFVPNFSVDARLAIALPILFGQQLSISLFTLTPGVGATVLF